jgi:1A family penicillin-binding protein
MSKIKHYHKIINSHKKLHLKHLLAFKIIIPLIVSLALLIGIGIFFYWIIFKDLPSPSKLAGNTGSYSSQIFDRNGKLLYTIYSDRNQTFVPLDKIPKTLQEATIAIEDKDFYKHGPIDLRGILRAAYITFLKKTQVQGGSTLTQQLVKNGLLTQERTFTRKAKELVLSFATELSYSKNKILEMYLNQVPYGGTAYGVEAAAQTYFGKQVRDLDLAQQAYLAGLPEAPSTYSPFGSHPELGKARQEEILKKMVEQGYITKNQQQTAAAEQLKFQKISNPIQAPHFVFYIKDLLTQKYGSDVVEHGGLKVYTSLDLNLQNYAQNVVATEIAGIKTAYHVTNGAALITNPGTGEILAMIGSHNYFDPKNGNVNMTIAHLQPGSSIKPLNYATGLSKGYNAATTFVDQPLCFDAGNGTNGYCPHNYDGKFHGAVSMRLALGNSFNIPAVEMLKLNGLNAFIATASAMGISTFKDPSQYGLSLTLGGGEVMMTDMATAFGVFANQGYRVDLHPILKVTDRKGNVLEQYTPPKSPIFGKKVLAPGITYIMSDMLADNNARLQEFGPSSELKIGKQFIPVKTGTTDDFKDNWTIGYTPNYLVAVWVGNNDRTPMSGIASGITGAAPIWNKLMSNLVKGKNIKESPKPPDVITKFVCATSGLLPPPDGTPNRCPIKSELFVRGSEPNKVDPGNTATWVDKTTQALAKPGQTDNVEAKDEYIVSDPLGHQFCISCPVPTTPSPTPNP